MAKSKVLITQTDTDPAEDGIDEDGDQTVPPEEQLFLLPGGWNPFSTTNGDGDLITPEEEAVLNDPAFSFGWNEKLGRWIDGPSEM